MLLRVTSFYNVTYVIRILYILLIISSFNEIKELQIFNIYLNKLIYYIHNLIKTAPKYFQQTKSLNPEET